MSFEIWKGRRVFLTGHTGFKGSWLSMVLSNFGAKVIGYGLSPISSPNLFDLLNIVNRIEESYIYDVRNLDFLSSCINKEKPEVIFHFAAQPLVRKSYSDPVETWSTNVMGTVNLLEAARTCPSVKAIIVITTDKCYENKEWSWGYRESDPLGGFDPYSSSKACAELVVSSYRKAFLSDQNILLATARAGNVVGGGDWSQDRLIPDAARAVANGKNLFVRNPSATRPWQHVLEAINGYLTLAEKLLQGEVMCAKAYNFGPDLDGNRSVFEVLTKLSHNWRDLHWEYDDRVQPHEAQMLYLDTSLARNELKWYSRWSFDECMDNTSSWYSEVASNKSSASEITLNQINNFFG